MAPALILQGNSVIALFSEFPDKLSASPEPVCIHSPKNCPVNADFETHTVWALLTAELLQSRDKVPGLQTSYILVIESPKKEKSKKKQNPPKNKRVNKLENFRVASREN